MWFNRKPFVSKHVVGQIDEINNRFYSHLFYEDGKVATIALRRTRRVGFINVDIRNMMMVTYEKD